MRQIDLRATPDSPILLKIFVSWDHDHQRWHAFAEGPEEMVWEKNVANVEVN